MGRCAGYHRSAMNNNDDDTFLGRPVRFNKVGRKADDPNPDLMRTPAVSASRRSRTWVGVILLLFFALGTYLASTYYFGGIHRVDGLTRGPIQSKDLSAPAGF